MGRGQTGMQNSLVRYGGARGSGHHEPIEIDEHYLNQRIMKLNQDRQRVHEIAAKYGIKNNVKVPQLSLIVNANGQAYGASPSKYALKAIEDPRDRMKEYHAQVNERRKKIHVKNQAKRKEQEELE